MTNAETKLRQRLVETERRRAAAEREVHALREALAQQRFETYRVYTEVESLRQRVNELETRRHE